MSGNEQTEPVEDFLSVDTPIPGQNFACISFVSPEKELANKDLFQVHRFLEEKAETYGLSPEKLTEAYDDYIYHNMEQLEKDFSEKNDFRTTVRGVKVRGIYDSYREAQVRAKLLQRKDSNFHVYVGQVGYWLPWDPNADDIDDQEYTEGQLNKLVKKYKENQQKREVFFEEQKRKSLDTIRKESVDKKEAVENKSSESSNALPSLDKVDPWMQRKLDAPAQVENDTPANAPAIVAGGEPAVLDLDA